MKKNILAAVLAGVMVLGAGTVSALAAEEGSYEMSGDSTIITVRVPLGGDADWYIDPDSTALELLTDEITEDGIWVGSFRAAGTVGQDELEVRCFADGLLYGYYKVDTEIDSSGVITVTNAYGNMDDYDEENSDISSTEFGQAGFEEYAAYVTSTSLKLRNAPVDGDVRASMPNGSQVWVVGMTDDNWAMVVYGDEVGYCYNGYLSTTEASGEYTASGLVGNSFNIRTDSDGYIFSESSSAYLTADELAGWNGNELQMAINEIYARHGRRFALTSVQNYFDTKPWYTGTISPLDFNPNVLSTIEVKNIALMENYMAANSLHWDFS